MTTRRLIASLTASAAALALAITLAVRAFPLEAQGVERPAGSGPVQVLEGGEHLLHGDVPEYPRRAAERSVQGDVVLEMTLNDRGEVSDARVVRGPDELRRAALEAVLNWHYSPEALEFQGHPGHAAVPAAARRTSHRRVPGQGDCSRRRCGGQGEGA